MTSEKSIFVDDLKKNVSVAQELLEGFTKILIRIETLGRDFLHEFDNTYEVQSKLINSFIQETKKCIQDIKITKIQDEEKQNYVEELEKLEREKREKVQISESIYDNICERFEKLEIKCTADILNLPDLAILNEKKYFQKIESNFNEILDRVVD